MSLCERPPNDKNFWGCSDLVMTLRQTLVPHDNSKKKFLELLDKMDKELGSFSTMSVHAMRLEPGQDLFLEMEKIIKLKDIKAATIISCVGSLKEVNLRFYPKIDHYNLLDTQINLQELV